MSNQQHHAEQPNTNAPSPERQAELEAVYERQKYTRSPYRGIRIETLGEVQWILGRHGWSTAGNLPPWQEKIFATGRPRPPRANLRGAILAGVNLRHAALKYADLQEVDLSGADLEGVDLQYVNLSGALLIGANLLRAQLHDAMLVRANLIDARLGENDWRVLANSNALTMLNLSGAILRGQRLSGFWLHFVQLGGADLTGADLHGIYFSQGAARRANFSGADLSEADFHHAELGGAILAGANLRHTRLSRAKLWEANLANADLSGSDLSYANLRSAQLDGANLREAVLFVANLGQASLDLADLRGADFTAAELPDASLREANLEGTNLAYATLTGADLSMVQGKPEWPPLTADNLNAVYRRHDAATSPAASGAQVGEWPLPGSAAEVPMPARLASLGFAGRSVSGVDVIIPPVCDVPEGEFIMGFDSSTPPNRPQAKGRQHCDFEPAHSLVIEQAYQIGTYPVTVAEYACAVRAGVITEPHAYTFSHADWVAPEWRGREYSWRDQLERPDHPVVMVSWIDALAYVRWLALTAGQPWRLPTEAEWEKAARGTDGRLYPWGTESDGVRADRDRWSEPSSQPVGAYPEQGDASPYGVHDLCGNVSEWVSSIHYSYPYTRHDGRENLRADALYHGTEYRASRVSRGGRLGEIFYRSHWFADSASINCGFRLARLAREPLPVPARGAPAW